MRFVTESMHFLLITLVTSALVLSCAPAQAKPDLGAPIPVATVSGTSQTAPQAPTPTPSSGLQSARPEQPTPRPGTPTQTTGATPATSNAPQRGGVLTIVTAGDPPSLDPTQATTMLSVTIAGPAYNKIVQRNPLTGDAFIPDLAERWEVSNDGLTYTFAVRQGVKFHDGVPLTAEDVRNSLSRNIDPPKGVLSTWAFVLKPAVQSVDVSSNTVQIKLRYPLAPLMAILAIDHNPIYPKHVLAAKGDMKTTVLGTGPFKFVSYTPGVGAELVRNNEYFVAGRPYLDGIRVNIVKDNATRLAAIRTGRVLLAGRVFSTLSPSEVKAVQQSIPDLKVYPSPSFNGPEFFMNTRRAPFDDIRVRRAVSLALDRSAAMKIMADGQASAPTYFPVPGWGLPEAELRQMPGFREPKDQDLAEAKRLLSQASSIEPSSQLTILARASTPITRDASIFMQGQLASMGLKSTIDVQEDGPFFTAGREARHQAMIFTPTGLLGDPIFMGRFYVPGGDFNFSGNGNDQQLISMWEQQTKTLDVTKRRALFNDIERHLIKDALPSIPIVWPTRYIVHQPQVRNFVPGVSDFDFNNLQELWLAR